MILVTECQLGARSSDNHGHHESIDGEAAFAAFDIWSGVRSGDVVF
jgi:hypothetical protein